MNNSYCVCTNPLTYDSYVGHWGNFNSFSDKLVFISDNTSDENFNVGFTYNESDIRKNLNFDKKLSTTHFWNCVGNRNIIWFYAHFRMLNYYISNPDFDNYWFFDDDIKCDNWVEFFKGVETDDSDFISYFCFKNINVKSQLNVPKINSNAYSYRLWFNRFPGDGDELPQDISEYFGSFFPVVKFSNKAMQTLLEINNNGYSGYSEGFVPTMLNKYGLKLSTLINENNESKYFDVNLVNILHKNSKINWEWI